MKAAPALKAGDLVAIAAPSGSFDRQRFKRGLQVLQSWGLKPIVAAGIYERHRYFAGHHARRLCELQTCLDHPHAKAILFARGGFGLHPILPELSFRGLTRYPKRIVGYSDLTMLLNQTSQKTGLLSYYGPTVCNLGAALAGPMGRRLRQTLMGHELPALLMSKRQILRAGSARARLAGGCLTLLVASLKTPFEIKTKGRILVLEDTAEEIYRVERMLLHLKQAGKFQGIKGLVIADFNCGGIRHSHNTWTSMLREVLREEKIPIVYGLKFGHGTRPQVLSLGAYYELNTRQEIFKYRGP